jgi:hypothetical protein
MKLLKRLNPHGQPKKMAISEARGLCRAPKDTNTRLTFPQHPQKDPHAVSFPTQRGCPAQKQILLQNPPFFRLKKTKPPPTSANFFFTLEQPF